MAIGVARRVNTADVATDATAVGATDAAADATAVAAADRPSDGTAVTATITATIAATSLPRDSRRRRRLYCRQSGNLDYFSSPLALMRVSGNSSDDALP